MPGAVALALEQGIKLFTKSRLSQDLRMVETSFAHMPSIQLPVGRKFLQFPIIPRTNGAISEQPLFQFRNPDAQVSFTGRASTQVVSAASREGSMLERYTNSGKYQVCDKIPGVKAYYGTDVPQLLILDEAKDPVTGIRELREGLEKLYCKGLMRNTYTTNFGLYEEAIGKAVEQGLIPHGTKIKGIVGQGQDSIALLVETAQGEEKVLKLSTRKVFPEKGQDVEGVEVNIDSRFSIQTQSGHTVHAVIEDFTEAGAIHDLPDEKYQAIIKELEDKLKVKNPNYDFDDMGIRQLGRTKDGQWVIIDHDCIIRKPTPKV